MKEGTEFAVVELAEFVWPESLHLPGKRFRILVAGDTTPSSIDRISDFATSALEHGMVYFCAWGPGCERLHDIVDEVIREDDLGGHKFRGATPRDTVMTTWHDKETLEEALDFLATCAVPTDGYAPDSDFRIVICVRNTQWAARAIRFLKDAEFFI